MRRSDLQAETPVPVFPLDVHHRKHPPCAHALRTAMLLGVLQQPHAAHLNRNRIEVDDTSAFVAHKSTQSDDWSRCSDEILWRGSRWEAGELRVRLCA